MPTLTLDQFLAYVAGSILDEYEVYDCPDHIYRSVLWIVNHHYEQAGFDYNTITRSLFRVVLHGDGVGG